MPGSAHAFETRTVLSLAAVTPLCKSLELILPVLLNFAHFDQCLPILCQTLSTSSPPPTAPRDHHATLCSHGLGFLRFQSEWAHAVSVLLLWVYST
jgi:hypothetical protein